MKHLKQSFEVLFYYYDIKSILYLKIDIFMTHLYHFFRLVSEYSTDLANV